MSKDDPNVMDSNGKIEEDTEKLLKDDPEGKNEENTKKKLKGDLKEKTEEDIKKMSKEDPKEVSSFVKRKPPKELMKGGLRDRSLLSWLRILGWILLLRFSLLIATFTFNLCSCSVVTALWWAFIFGFLTSCFVLMWVSLPPLSLTISHCHQKMLCNFRYAILYGSEEDSRVPYFVRNQHKYPDILPQPGVNIECVSTSLRIL